jgi:glycosyltransferase involved in cell wall biosynthesis
VLAVTAHNLHAHNRPNEPFAFHNAASAFRQAQVVFAHSEAAKALLIKTYGLNTERVEVIPHGDLSVVLGPPLPRAEARQTLGLGAEKICLMFGAVEPYKGIEEVIAFWRDSQPDCTLVIAGKPCSREYGGIISKLATVERVHLRLGWLADEQLRLWLSAADAVLFNYRTIFTSGAANLARSYGIPQLLPSRLETVVLGEPAPAVFRFDSLDGDFRAKLDAACALGIDYAGAADWRLATSWDQVAELTAAAYRKAIERVRGA